METADSKQCRFMFITCLDCCRTGKLGKKTRGTVVDGTDDETGFEEYF